MIEVRRVDDGGALSFEVVVREGKGETSSPRYNV